MNKCPHFPLSILLTLLVCLPLLALTAPQAQAAPPAPNIIQYVPEEDWHEGMSPEEQAKKAHTIHWTYGINPPIMGHELNQPSNRTKESVGAFSHEKLGNSVDYYVAPYKAGNGWYDVNKNKSERSDSNSQGSDVLAVNDSQLCFVLSSINLIHWWMEQNSSQIESYLKSHSNETLRTYFASQGSAVAQRPDQNPIWKLLTTNATFLKFKGGWPHNVMDYFFNGYSPSAAHNPDRNLPSSFPTSPTEGGGLFYDVFGKSILTDLRAAKGFQADGEAMTKELDQGNGLIAIVGAAGGTHAITVWGTEYDETGRLCAVYVVDNNDTGRAQGADRITGTDDIIGMIRYNAFETDTHKLHLDSAPNIFGKQVLHNFAVLTLAQNGWEYFLQNGKPLYEEDGHAFLNPIKEAPPLCETHTFEVMHGGSKIVKHCKVCGYETGFLLSMGMDPQTTYTGQPLTPCQVSQINTSIYHRDFWYTDNINVGTATAHMTAIIDGTLYEATLNFQIKPQPAEPPTETPVQNGEAEIYGFSLQPIAGREFAVWPANRDLDPQAAQWREDGQFTDLLPDTQYQVYIRSLSSHPGDKNYTHSEPVKTALTVTTKSDAQLGEPSWSLETIAVQDGNVTVQVHNTGKRDTATLILAGYDGNDRQVMTHMQTVTAAGETVTVTVPGQGSARYKAFLLDDRSTPITPAKAS